MPRPILVDAHFIGSLVGKHQVSQELLLEFHRTGKALAIWSNFGLQNNKVEVERLRCDDAINQVSVVGLVSTGEEYSQGVFLLQAQLY